MKAFIVYVRPTGEYCSVVWSPSLKKDIELIETVQRRFTKRLPGLKHMSYNDRNTALSWLVESRITTFAFGSDILL